MLHRSSSSRRRRASRSAATSPQARAPRSGSQPPSPRRASIVPDDEAVAPETKRSPRHSIAPQPDHDAYDGAEPLPTYQRSPRSSLAPEAAHFKGSRNSLTADQHFRSPRHSLVPEAGSRSARNSIVPDSNASPRNMLLLQTDRNSRHSLVPENAYGSRLSLNPQDFNRSPRNSITPDQMARSPRRSLVPENSGWNQPRNSLVPDTNRSPRHSVASIQVDPSHVQIMNISPEVSRSPRCSIAPDIGPGKEANRSPRGSIGPEGGGTHRSPRGSLVGEARDARARGGLVPDSSEQQRLSSRGSLTLTFQEPLVSRERRASDDSAAQGTRGRSLSPYRSSLGGGGGGGGGTGGRGGTQINHGYSGSMWSEAGSRRASSSVSQFAQVSGDEQRRLCGEQSKYGYEGGGLGLGMGLTTYGSVAYQLKDANMEANGTCDFMCRAIRIVNRTVLMTVLLGCLSTLPVIMLIMGVQYLRDCPREPHLPVYMVVGGSVGGIKMAWVLWQQLGTRTVAGAPPERTSIASRVASLILTMFLVAWFALGNYWIMRIKWPDYQPTLFEPNNWCHKTLYVFSLTHLCIIYVVLGSLMILIITLGSCQIIGCSWLGPSRYK